MQIRIRSLSGAALETVQRAAHAFAAPIEDMGIDHSRLCRLRPSRHPANGGRTGEPSPLAPKIRV